MQRATTISHPAPHRVRRPARRYARGVSLIELAVAVAIAAILLGLAAPQYSTWIGNVQIRTATDSIQSGMQLARAEAIRRNTSVTFWLTSTAAPQTADWMVGCTSPSGNGAQPEAPGDCPGINKLADLTANGPPYNWIQQQTATAQQTSQPQISSANTATELTFSSLGMVTTNLDGSASITQIDVAQPALAAAHPLRITVGSGQVRLCDPQLSVTNDPRGC
jgi:type IV fimbrial biogenesis protein FimT